MPARTVPIAEFVRTRYHTARIQQIVEPWRVEPDEICEILARHFADMGIYTVNHQQNAILVENMVHTLKYSTEVMQVVNKARKMEFLRRRSRHSD